ncbi:MAG: GH92 family glycosyl hydrolase [Kiritimatiellae bacterium]|nr:GH92 family glycosyl hydrolase [Kiritimatiellia bacterium]
MLSVLVIAAALTVDFSKEVRSARPELHSSGFSPRICSSSQADVDDVRSMGFKMARTHDWALINSNERVCDNHHVFPLNHLDPKDPKSYHFAPTDYLLGLVREKYGQEIFFRLGTSIEHSGKKVHFNTLIPDDFDRVAENFAATVRHYNRGWANGFEWGIKYWEIWNEPDGANTMWCLPEGDLGEDGKRDEQKDAERQRQFVRFFVTVLKRLKSEFGDTIKVGGPAMTSLYPNREDYMRAILRACKEANVAPDFISWHFYVEDYSVIADSIRLGRKICDEEGFPKCELVMDEWHYFSFSDYDWPDLRSSDPVRRAKAWTGPRSHNGIDSSCFNLATLSRLQTSDMDLAFYYGCRPEGSWGYKDYNNEKYKVFYGLKMFGDFMRGGGTICRGEVIDPEGPALLTALPLRKPDGKSFQLLVSDYRVGCETIQIDVAGLPKGMTAKGEVHDGEHDLAPADFEFDGHRLVIRKAKGASAAYCFEFSACGDLASHVDPFIGTDTVGHTHPSAAFPFGMVQAGPDTGTMDWKYCSGYQWMDKEIIGFSQTHLSGTGCPDLGDVSIMPVAESKLKVESEKLKVAFDKTSEVAEPGYYSVVLKDPEVKVEIAASPHSAIYRLTMLGDGPMNLLVEPRSVLFNPPEFPRREPERLAFAVVKDAEGGIKEMSGAYRAHCWTRRELGYCLAFDHSARDIGRGIYSFDVKRGETIVLKVGLSAGGDVADGSNGVSLAARARNNLVAEIPDWDFDTVRNAARAEWNRVLGVATIEGTEEQKKNWYTALYHLCLQPNNIADVGAKPFYSTFSTWDTFRAAHPLYTILAPEKAGEFVDSLLEQGRRTGYLPIWALWGKDNQCMIGTHSIPVIVDWFLKDSFSHKEHKEHKDIASSASLGTRSARLGSLQIASPACAAVTRLCVKKQNEYWLAAYAQIKDTLTKPHDGRIKERWDLYDKYGYYPSDIVKGESVSRTLECGYDDWCAGVMAEKMGERVTGNGELDKRLKADAEFFFRRSENWRNVFDPSIGLVRGKTTTGKWRDPFDPYEMGHGAENDNDFTEGNAFQYTWHVMQNPQGLVDAMGGRESFVEKLDSLFLRPDKVEGAECVVDVTGLIGQYVHGNEPSHHVIYFYPQVGHPEKAAERIREVFDKFYLPKPDGLCGNDDCGQMSAWYLFCAMGFYPFNPCGGEYVIGAPQVPKVTIKLVGASLRDARGRVGDATLPGECKTLTIIARNLSRENKYVKSVTLNGKPITGWKIRHSDIMAGGELVFEMGANP